MRHCDAKQWLWERVVDLGFAGKPGERVATLFLEWGPVHKALETGRRICRPLPVEEEGDPHCAGASLLKFLWFSAKQGHRNACSPVFIADDSSNLAIERDAMVQFIRHFVQGCRPDGTNGSIDVKQFGTHSPRIFFISTAFNRKISREVAMEYAQFSKKSKIAKELYHGHSKNCPIIWFYSKREENKNRTTLVHHFFK